MPAMSMPSSSALVVASARILPERRPSSSARLSSARNPPRYAAMAFDPGGVDASSACCSRTRDATYSTARLLRRNVRTWHPWRTAAEVNAAASRVADEPPSSVGDCHRTTVRSGVGEESSVMAVTGAPMSRATDRSGAPDVADAAITTGLLR